jgi:hypothetical protein
VVYQRTRHQRHRARPRHRENAARHWLLVLVAKTIASIVLLIVQQLLRSGWR